MNRVKQVWRWCPLSRAGLTVRCDGMCAVAGCDTSAWLGGPPLLLSLPLQHSAASCNVRQLV